MAHLLASCHHRADIFLRSCIDLKIYLSEMNFKLALLTVCVLLMSTYLCMRVFVIVCLCLRRISERVFLILYTGRACVCVNVDGIFTSVVPKGPAFYCDIIRV